MSEIIPLLPYHDKELKHPIDETIDLGSFDVHLGLKKKWYLFNLNKYLTANLIVEGKAVNIPPRKAAELEYVIPPLPEAQNDSERLAFLKAKVMGSDDFTDTVHADITWVKAER